MSWPAALVLSVVVVCLTSLALALMGRSRGPG